MTIQPFTILELATAGTALAGAIAPILRKCSTADVGRARCAVGLSSVSGRCPQTAMRIWKKALLILTQIDDFSVSCID